MTSLNKVRSTCALIAEDMERDAKTLDGQPFNGRVVATQFGNHCAAVRALALAVSSLADEIAEAQRSADPRNFSGMDGR